MKNIKKITHIVKDSAWSIAGTLFMTCAAQFLVYPLWERNFGSEKYGTIIYLISLMNIVSLTFGSAAGYTRIMLSARRNTKNIPYLLLLSVLSAVAVAYSLMIAALHQEIMSSGDMIGFTFLCVLTAWRSYADVEYRIHLNYIGFFMYYLLIGTGYMLGLFFMYLTNTWTASLITGEAAGLLYILFRGHIFRKDDFTSGEMSEMLKLFFVLLGSYFINTLIFNADRILLKTAVDSLAVSIYYISSLFGKTLALITIPLNGVISGYIVRFKGALKRKYCYILIAGMAFVALAASFVCTLASYIILPILYPETFLSAKNSIFICSIAQTIYFSTDILAVIMLRFADKKHQMISNIVYAACFAVICVPMTFNMGLQGFCFGMIITSLSRYIYNSVVLLVVMKQKKAGDIS